MRSLQLLQRSLPHGSVTALLEDCVACAADKLITEAGGPAWDEAGFVRLKDHVRAELADTTALIFSHAQRILAALILGPDAEVPDMVGLSPWIDARFHGPIGPIFASGESSALRSLALSSRLERNSSYTRWCT